MLYFVHYIYIYINNAKTDWKNNIGCHNRGPIKFPLKTLRYHTSIPYLKPFDTIQSGPVLVNDIQTLPSPPLKKVDFIFLSKMTLNVLKLMKNQIYDFCDSFFCDSTMSIHPKNNFFSFKRCAMF